jgi:hypothetical protein
VTDFWPRDRDDATRFWAPVLENLLGEWEREALSVDRLWTRLREGTLFDPEPGSAMQLDDEASDPYRVSYAVRHCLDVGVGQLRASRMLMEVDERRQFIAVATLLRSALESLAIAFWIVHPDARGDRVSRALSFWVSNIRDEATAFSDLTGRDIAPDDRISQVRAVAVRNGVAMHKGVQNTEVLRYTDTALKMPSQLLLYVWRFCSGVAHGRSWALSSFGHGLPSGRWFSTRRILCFHSVWASP